MDPFFLIGQIWKKMKDPLAQGIIFFSQQFWHIVEKTAQKGDLKNWIKQHNSF